MQAKSLPCSSSQVPMKMSQTFSENLQMAAFELCFFSPSIWTKKKTQRTQSAPTYRQISNLLISNCSYQMTNHIMLQFSLGNGKLQVGKHFKIILHQLTVQLFCKSMKFTEASYILSVIRIYYQHIKTI